MKKILALLLCVLMVACFVACKKNNNTQQAQIANPMHEYKSLDEINKATGATLQKPANMKVESESFYVIEGSNPVAEYRFECDGSKYCFRFGKVDASQDISGYYYNGPLFGESDTGICFKNPEEGMYAVRWFVKDGQYCLTAQGNITNNDFTKLVYSIINTEK